MSVQFFEPTVLSIAPSVLYVLPSTDSGVTTQAVRLRFANITSSPASVSAYAVPKGSGVAVSNAIALSVAIGANDFLDMDAPVLSPGDYYAASASIASAVVVSQVSGVLVS